MRAKVGSAESSLLLDRGEAEKFLIKNPLSDKAKKAEKVQDDTPIPNVSKLILSPPPPIIGGDKTVSFAVTDQVPLKDVLIELGRVASIDIDIDPGISGGVIINAKNRPLKEILDRIATMGQLRYSYKNGVLHFERDAPYMKSYFVDYLSEGSVWSDVEKNLSIILSTAASSSSSSPAVGTDTGTGDTAAVSSSSSSEATVSTNKSAGIISIYATDKQHRAVAKYLAEVDKYASSQVLIEAKVVEVVLSDEYQAGIDWSWLVKLGGTKLGTISRTGSTIANAFVIPAGTGIRKAFGGDITAAISLLETYGITKTLSSPRIHAINNQKATISFTDKLVFFNTTTTQSVTGANTGTTTNPSNVVTTTATATAEEMTTGTELSITPSINLRTNEITMNIKPKITVGVLVVDPISGKRAPSINSRDIDTMVKATSGNVVVIGGLMKENYSSNETGVPILSTIPIIRWFFKSTNKKSVVTETVIFIKATIVDSSTQTDKSDREIQENFDSNKRKFF